MSQLPIGHSICRTIEIVFLFILLSIGGCSDSDSDSDSTLNLDDSSSGADSQTGVIFDSDTTILQRDTTGPSSAELCEKMNCNDGNDCTEDKCEQARCFFVPTAACGVGAPAQCVHWDDVCGQDCDWTQDYDCAQWAWQIPLEMPSLTAYTNIIYIDPTYDNTAETSDGSQAHPFTTWDSIDFLQLPENSAVLQKRGTETRVGWTGALPTISVRASNVLIGAYGDASLPRPRLNIFASVAGSGNHLIFRDLELLRTIDEERGGPARAINISGAHNVIYNVWIHGTSEENRFKYACINAGGSRGFKVLHSDISHCGEEVVMGGGPLIEIGYNRMEKVAYPNGGNGDGFQFGDDVCQGMWFHNNDFDGRFIDAKFFIISTSGQTTALIENNHIKMAQNRSATHIGGDLIIMRGNLFEYIESAPGGTGLWLTGGNYEIYHNVFYNYAKGFTAAGTRKVFNNTFVGYTDVALSHGSNSDVRNNIFASPASAWGQSGMTSSHNLFFTQSTVSPAPTDTLTIVADPLLEDPANRNFGPATGSPATDAGDISALSELTPLSIDGGVWRDYNGYPIKAETINIGALETLAP